MSDFEEYIKVNYPRDYERQKRIYPDQNVEELYSEDHKMWQHQQAIIDEHTEVIKLQDADLRKYEKQIESLKTQLSVYKEDMAKDAEKIAELTNKIEKPCRWCGFENKRGAND